MGKRWSHSRDLQDSGLSRAFLLASPRWLSLRQSATFFRQGRRGLFALRGRAAGTLARPEDVQCRITYTGKKSTYGNRSLEEAFFLAREVRGRLEVKWGRAVASQLPQI